jgi:hypothetical protein
VPFVRFSRDRRGYEHTYLIHAAPRRGAPTRILYWYRTPPGIKVGREAFDVEARRMLETQYPSVSFDWPKLLETPMPPPEAENWRERRRVERSARQARQTEDPEDVTAGPIEMIEPPHPQPIQEAAVDVPSIAPEAEETDTPGSDTASRKRRRRGGRRRRRSGSTADPNASPDQAPDAGADSLAIQGTADSATHSTPDSETTSLPSSPDSRSEPHPKASD